MVPNGAAALEWQRVKDEISGDLTDLLREAPLQIQMVVNLVKPIISTFMSSLAETVAEQQESVSSLMSTAQLCLESDDRVAQLLGSRLQMSSPFSPKLFHVQHQQTNDQPCGTCLLKCTVPSNPVLSD